MFKQPRTPASGMQVALVRAASTGGGGEHMMMLAQSGFAQLDAPAPQPLPTTGIFDLYLLENPWFLMIGATIIALVVYVLLTTRGKSGKARLAMVLGICIAGVVFALATFVDTPREQLKMRTIEFIGAVARADTDIVQDVLAADAILYSPITPDGARTEQILARVKQDMAQSGRYAVKDVRVIEIQAAMTGASRGIVQVKVRATSNLSGFPIPSWWRIDFERDGDSGEWDASGISMLSIGAGINPR